jgi:S1-C subfamily serine protease
MNFLNLRKYCFLLLAMGGSFVFSPTDTVAADFDYLSRSDRLNGWKTLEDFNDLFRSQRASVVEILDNGKQVGLGTIVSKDGLIVTKASEFGHLLEVRLFDYSKHIPELVSVDEVNDLALLKIGANELQPVEWADSANIQMGQWVISPHEDKTQVRIGVVSTLPREVPKQFGALGVVSVGGADYISESDLLDLRALIKRLHQGTRPIDLWLKNEISDGSIPALMKDGDDPSHQAVWLDTFLRNLNTLISRRNLYSVDRFEGVRLSPKTKIAIQDRGNRIGRPVFNRMLLVDSYPENIKPGMPGALIVEVVKDSAAENSDLEPGDVILAIDSDDVGGSQDLTRLVRNHGPGETIILSIFRDDKQLNKVVTLGYFDSTFPGEDVNIALSGEISDRRRGFQEIIQHDMPLPPKAMGGPLLTFDGKVIGINIARFDRVATFALPSSLVQTLIDELK